MLFTDIRQSDRASKNNASMNGETSVAKFPVALRFLFMFLSCHAYEGVSSPQGFLGALHSPACLGRCPWPRRGLHCSCLPSTAALRSSSPHAAQVRQWVAELGGMLRAREKGH